MSSSKDYVGQWFRVFRKLNEPTEIKFVVKSKNKIHNLSINHEETDGIGALYKISKKFDWTISPLVNKSILPGIKPIRFFLNILMFLFWTRRRRSIWPFLINKSDYPKTIEAIYLCTHEESLMLQTRAKNLGVSLNCLLFFKINRLIMKKCKIEKKASWWIPVNMRPDLGLQTENSENNKNYVSNFTVDIGPNDSITVVNRQLRESLKNQKHWGTWWWQNIGRYVPESIIEKIAFSNLKSRHYIGAFSNLGEWTCSEKDSELIFSVPPLVSQPVGAGAIIWNNCLNLSLRVYPGIPLDHNELHSLLKDWVHSEF